jgi:hypothetical protein
MGELVEITFDREPFNLDREPDVRLVTPSPGIYEVRVGADGQAELMAVWYADSGEPMQLEPTTTIAWPP